MPQWNIDGEDLYVCPKGSAPRWTWLWIKWYGHYKNHLLPVAGGILDQSAKYVEAMEIIDVAIGKIREK